MLIEMESIKTNISNLVIGYQTDVISVLIQIPESDVFIFQWHLETQDNYGWGAELVHAIYRT